VNNLEIRQLISQIKRAKNPRLEAELYNKLRLFYCSIYQRRIYQISRFNLDELISKQIIFTFDKLNDIKLEENVMGYLFRCCLNSAISYLRANKKKPIHVEYYDIYEYNQESNQLDKIIQKETELELKKIIKTLKKEDQNILKLKSQGYKENQISKTMSIGVKAIGMRIFRSKKVIKIKLSKVDNL
jgi:DNA-directed RNA polymerase specialized sigma24 family protein